jgi:hypothetical protein
MYVHIGNSAAVEGYRDESSDDPELVRYRPVEGERVTEVVFPDGTGVSEAFTTTLGVLTHHMAEGSTPDWVTSDNDALAGLLAEHWGLGEDRLARPETYGSETGANHFATEER